MTCGAALALAATLATGARADAAGSDPAQPTAEPSRAAVQEASERAVWACDRRKLVLVQGVRPGEKMSPAKAQQVAALLTDLMRFCDAEVVARVSSRELITLSVNGLPYVQYVPGSEPPVELVHGGVQHTPREQAIWKAELDKLVAEGDRLFHGDEIGTNGIACAMCHPDASNTHPETYPKFQTQLKKVALLRDMVNWCIENPLEGPKLSGDDPRMGALEAYILSKRTGVALEAGKH
jgi:thiosulfate dehydrogenase